MVIDSMVDLENALGASMASLLDEDQRIMGDDEDEESAPTQQQVDKEDEEPELEVPKTIIDDDGVEYEPAHPKPREKRPSKHKEGIYAVRMYRSKDPKSKRSFLSEGTIFINVLHPAFSERLSLDRRSSVNVSLGPRLASYLSNELAQYYRQDFYDKFHLPVPQERSKLYEELLDSSTVLEKRLFSKLAQTKVPAKVFAPE
jgi:hypothetical protein